MPAGPLSPGRTRAILGIALASVLALTGCSLLGEAGSDGNGVRDLGQGVTLVSPEGAFSSDAELRAEPVTAPEDTITGLPSAARVEITTNEQPRTPVELRIPVEPALFDELPAGVDGAVLVLHHHGDSVEPLSGRLDRGLGLVSVTTSSLSWFDVRLPSLKALGEQVLAIGNGILSDIVFNASDPRCPDEQAARAAGWRVSSTRSPMLKWCLGLRNGKPELRVVANRRYPVLATLGKKLAVRSTTGGEIPVAIAQAATEAASNGRQVTLSPGGTTVLDVSLAAGESTRLRAELDGFAQSLVALQVAADLLLAIAKRVPFSNAKDLSRADVLATIDAAGCVPAALDLTNDPTDSGRVGKMVSSCLDPASIFKGASGVVIAAISGVVLALASAVSFVWTSLRGLADLVRGKDKYEIRISKVGVANLPSGCDENLATRAVCRFVDAVVRGTTTNLTATEREVAATTTDLPDRPWQLDDCELEGDITLVCRINFPTDEPNTEWTAATFHVQPFDADYDPETGRVTPRDGKALKYHVITYDGMGV